MKLIHPQALKSHLSHLSVSRKTFPNEVALLPAAGPVQCIGSMLADYLPGTTLYKYFIRLKLQAKHGVTHLSSIHENLK